VGESARSVSVSAIEPERALLHRPPFLGLGSHLAWIEAASRGLGRALGDAFAALAADLVLTARPSLISTRSQAISDDGRVVKGVAGSFADGDLIIETIAPYRSALGPPGQCPSTTTGQVRPSPRPRRSKKSAWRKTPQVFVTISASGGRIRDEGVMHGHRVSRER
jgi:NAD(P)-dependent dehydrogenase (short-subunit alcohol dehydrogenase family)